MKKFVLMVTMVALGSMVTADAQAYLDPGTGSLIIQGVIAGIAAVMVTGRLYWDKLKGLFRRPAKPELNSHRQGTGHDSQKSKHVD